MATFYWAGSKGYSMGWGYPGFEGGYLDGVTSGMSWNVSSNWLELTPGPSADCGTSGGGIQSIGYFTSASRCPGADDDVVVDYFQAGGVNDLCHRNENGVGVGLTGEYPKAPLLFGGYYNTNLAEGSANSWPGGGGWVNAGAGNTGARLNSFRVTDAYFWKPGTKVSFYNDGYARYPIGLLPRDVTKIESLTSKGGTFSGLQLYAKRFIMPRNENRGPGWDRAEEDNLDQTGYQVRLNQEQNMRVGNHVSLILSDIIDAQIDHWVDVELRGCTFDTLTVDRYGGLHWYLCFKLPEDIRKEGGHLTTLGPITSTIRGNAGNASWANFPSTVSNYLKIGGQTGGRTSIKTTATIPTVDVTTKIRSGYGTSKVFLDCDMTTCSLYPTMPELPHRNYMPCGHAHQFPQYDCFDYSGLTCNSALFQIGTKTPVVLTSTERAREGVHSIGTLNMYDWNDEFGHGISDKLPFMGVLGPNVKGLQNMFAIDCGLTCDKLNLYGGHIFIGASYGWSGRISDDLYGGCVRGNGNVTGTAKEDMHGVLIKDADLYYHSFIDQRHPSDPTWKRWKVGSGTVHASAAEGYNQVSPGGVVIYNCDQYKVSDFAYAGATSNAGLVTSFQPSSGRR